MATDQAAKLRDIANRLKTNRKLARKTGKTRRIAISSGKGGVGKSSFTLSLAVALTRLKRKVLLIDADINLGNIDILIGKTPEYMLRDVIEGRISLKELLIEGPGGFSIMPASSGDVDILKKHNEVKYTIEKELEQLELNYDFILVDTGAGIGDEVIDFALNSDEVVVVTTTEPTAFTDAYALIKVLTSRSPRQDISVMVNMINSVQEGEEIFNKIKMVANHFLQTDVKYLGGIARDAGVPKAIINQTPFFLMNEKSPASKNLWAIALKLATSSGFSGKKAQMNKENGSLFKNMIDK